MTEITNIIFNNGVYAIYKDREILVRTTREVEDEDLKTALVRLLKPIPKDTELVCKYYQNFYGTWLVTEYNGHTYYINPRYCDYIEMAEIAKLN